MKNKKINLSVIILCSIVFSVLYFLVYVKLTSNNEYRQVEVEKETLINNYKGLKEENISTYANSFNCNYSLPEYGNKYVKDVVLKTESSSVDCLDYNEKYILYVDNNKLKVYNSLENKYYVLNFQYLEENDYSLASTYKGDIVGLFYSVPEENGGNIAFYSIKNDKEMYKDGYYLMSILNDDYIAASGNDYRSAYVLSTNEEKVLLSKKYEGEGLLTPIYSLVQTYHGENENYIYLTNECNASECPQEDGENALYTKDLKLISNDFNQMTIDKDNHLILLNGDTITTYDKKGNIISSNNKYKNVLLIEEKYIIYINSNEVILASNNNDIDTMLTLDDGEKIVYSIDVKRDDKTENIEKFIIDVENKNVTSNEVWNYCSINDNCISEDKEDIESCTFGYTYEYNIKNKSSDKYPNVVEWCGW